MKYKPKPIYVSKVILPSNFTKLVNILANNLHDKWAQMRIAEGWVYGRHRNDAKKTHPCLVSYDDLPASERLFNKKIVSETLKAIIALGFKIDRYLESGEQWLLDYKSVNYDSLLQEIAVMDLQKLDSIWKILLSKKQRFPVAIYETLGSAVLKKGEPLIAFDIFSTGLHSWPGNTRLSRYLALSLAESGASERANEILTKLYKSGKLDSETIGILARTHKDLAWLFDDPTQMRKAHELYYEGYRRAKTGKNRGWLDQAMYTGINAATTALLAGDERMAVQLAREVRDICHKKLKTLENYWTLATLGEVEVILRNWSEAAAWYGKATYLARGNYRILSSTSRQAKTILNHYNEDRERFSRCFGIPRVVVFSGHMIDQPGRTHPRFPGYLEKRVGEEIRKKLDELDIGFGYSSAACGSDIIFIEEMLKRKNRLKNEKDIEVNIILPFPEDQFQRASVDIIPAANWGARYCRVIKKATKVIVASDHRATSSGVAYQYANLLQSGLAILRAKTMDTDMTPLVIWDGKGGDGEGGTSAMVTHWKSHGFVPEIIDISRLREEAASTSPVHLPEKAPEQTGKFIHDEATPGFLEEIRAMLYGDVTSYSKLLEEEIPNFINHFMKLVADVADSYRDRILAENTWGDAIFFVFQSVRDAGNFALDLRDRITAVDWKSKRLPETMNIRIALHAGPIFRCEDPVIKKEVYTGTHVSRAARIEQITPPGNVYASSEFAALASSMRVDDFNLNYVGQVGLPKKYGTYPVYHVTRKMGGKGNRNNLCSH